MRPQLNGGMLSGRDQRSGMTVDSKTTAVSINEGLRTYLGSDPNGGVTPYGMAERLRDKYGDLAVTVQSMIDEALGGLLEVPDSLRFESLEALSAFVSQRARTLRPNFDPDVCKAIGNYVSYGHR
jgi:hypothetical protein